MMNRIILIGNGFDLAHGLQTSYKEFIQHYWKKWAEILRYSNSHQELDGLTTILWKSRLNLWSNIISQWIGIYGPFKQFPAEKIIETIKSDTEDVQITMTPFFQAINQTLETKNWVDIENEYYQFLKNIFKAKNPEYSVPHLLDKELKLLQDKLIEYLKSIQEKLITPDLVQKDIRKIIYEPFNYKDISVEGRSLFDDFLAERWNKALNNDIECKKLLYRFGYDYQFDFSNIKKQVLDVAVLKHIDQIHNGSVGIHDYFRLPSEVLLLNFNYTKTADLYVSKKSEFKVNHIHGELGNTKNPIIFGYGDEMDEDYKTISNLNDNSYLTNIKSIRYLETDNYRQLLRFIGSAPYQIYIMGHSCGNSDRTLLNTLFEHKNCVSIKSYYYEWTDEEGGHGDNYIEIIQNISRNFNSMQLLRDRVVNKSYCRPLPQKPKVAAIE